MSLKDYDDPWANSPCTDVFQRHQHKRLAKLAGYRWCRNPEGKMRIWFYGYPYCLYSFAFKSAPPPWEVRFSRACKKAIADALRRLALKYLFAQPPIATAFRGPSGLLWEVKPGGWDRIITPKSADSLLLNLALSNDAGLWPGAVNPEALKQFDHESRRVSYGKRCPFIY